MKLIFEIAIDFTLLVTPNRSMKFKMKGLGILFFILNLNMNRHKIGRLIKPGEAFYKLFNLKRV